MAKQHFHMAATKVVFVDPEDQRAAHLEMNVCIPTENKNIRIVDIDRIQKQAQALFFKQSERPDYQVVDVFIYGISYLGHMTTEEFTYRPPVEEQAQGVEAMLKAAANDGPFN